VHAVLELDVELGPVLLDGDLVRLDLERVADEALGARLGLLDLGFLAILDGLTLDLSCSLVRVANALRWASFVRQMMFSFSLGNSALGLVLPWQLLLPQDAVPVYL